MDDYLLVCQNHPYLDDYCISLSIEGLMSPIIIQYWMIIIFLNTNHPKLDDFISDEIIIHFWMILYGNFHPFLDQEHTSQSLAPLLQTAEYWRQRRGRYVWQ